MEDTSKRLIGFLNDMLKDEHGRSLVEAAVIEYIEQQAARKNGPLYPFDREVGEPAPVRLSVDEERGIVQIETDLADSDSCLLAFVALYREMEQRHGIAAAQMMAHNCVRQDSAANTKRNLEWLRLIRESGISLEKFADSLAEENEQLKSEREKGRHSKDPKEYWLAMRADVALTERGPWGSSNPETIKRNVRKLRKKGPISDPLLAWVPRVYGKKPGPSR